MTTANRKPQTENRFFQIITFGCKVNQCDSAGLALELTACGWRPAPPGVAPHLALVNTCTVTARADQQARQAIRRLAREHPGLPLWVTGCYAQRAPDEVAALPGVQAVLGNQEKAKVSDLLDHLPENGPTFSVEKFPTPAPFHPWPVHPFPGHTRAWLKIQEGCNHCCTYCIVPRVRGPRRSLPPRQVLDSLQELAALGYREVVLTGVDLGQYGQDLTPGRDLAALVRQLKEVSWPFRVRLSSLEPQEVTSDLLRELASWDRFCPHFHLPLQSGAAAVLAAMGRPYGPEAFRDLAAEIHRLFPGAGLGLDVLVGFPGETLADFEATYTLVDSLPVSYLHVFPFSSRPGTPAARLAPLPGTEVRRRAGLLRELGQRKKLAFLHTQLGQVRQVLVEGPGLRKGWLASLSDHYLRVLLPGPAAWRNRLIMVAFKEVRGETLRGEAAGGTDRPWSISAGPSLPCW